MKSSAWAVSRLQSSPVLSNSNNVQLPANKQAPMQKQRLHTGMVRAKARTVPSRRDRPAPASAHAGGYGYQHTAPSYPIPRQIFHGKKIDVNRNRRKPNSMKTIPGHLPSSPMSIWMWPPSAARWPQYTGHSRCYRHISSRIIMLQLSYYPDPPDWRHYSLELHSWLLIPSLSSRCIVSVRSIKAAMGGRWRSGLVLHEFSEWC